MDKKLALFTMTCDLCAVARYATLMEGYVLSHFLIPSFFLLDCIDISKIDGGDFANISLSDYSDEKLTECDVIFMDYDSSVGTDLYEKIIKTARALNKEVVLSHKLNCTLTASNDSPILTERVTGNQLYDCNVPVIMILAQGAKVGQYAVELALRAHFLSKGYSISQIASNETGIFMGMQTMPDFLFENRDACEKIILFNELVSKLIAKEKPDVLLLGVPGAIMKYDNKNIQGLGVLPFIVSNAVRSDASIFCTYYNENLKTYFDEIVKYCYYRLDCDTGFFGISNTHVEIDTNTDINKLIYTTLDSERVLESIKNEIDMDSYFLFNPLNGESIKSLCESVESSLASNAVYVK